MSKTSEAQVRAALEMAIEYMMKDTSAISKHYWETVINACKEALANINNGNKFLGIINLESVDPLSETERKWLIEATMECLLEEGELGKLGMLLNRYEETVREAEQLSVNSEQLSDLQQRLALKDLEIMRLREFVQFYWENGITETLYYKARDLLSTSTTHDDLIAWHEAQLLYAKKG